MTCRRIAAALLWLTASAAALAEDATTVSTSDAGPAPAVPSGPIPLRERPLWELGIGVSGLRLPDYRGSDQSHTYALPFPYIVYRGTWLKSDREGTRARLFDSPRVKLDLSFGATAPTRGSEPGDAREGMPDLPGNAEVGPSLNITLDQSSRRHWKLDLRLPLRAAVTLQKSPRYVGVTFSPNLNLDIYGAAGQWNVGLLAGPLFADRKYHAQYYGVDPIYATPQRAAYRAQGGYAGWQTLASTSRHIGSTWVAGFVRHEYLGGAAYEDSPLVRRKSAVTVGFALSWVLFTSTATVASVE